MFKSITLHYFISLLITCCVWVACDSEPRPLSMDGGGTPDARLGGEEVIDAEIDSSMIDLGSSPDLGLDQSTEVMDLSLDSALPPPPEDLSESAVLLWGQQVFIVWRNNDEIWRSVSPAALREGTLISGGQKWFTLPVDFVSDKLTFKTSGRYDPLLILSAEGKESFVLNLEHDEPEAMQTGLGSPILTAEGDGAVLFLGPQMILSEEVLATGDKLAWRFFRSGTWGSLQTDLGGLNSIVGLAYGLGGWVLSDQLGQCSLLSERSGVQSSWRCFSQDNSIMLSDQNSLLHWGPLKKDVEGNSRHTGLWAWSGTPGRSVSPQDALIFDEDQSSLEPTLLPHGYAQLIGSGEFIQWLDKSSNPAALARSEEGEIYVYTRTGHSPLPEGILVEDVITVISSFEDTHLVIWNNEEARFDLIPLRATWRPHQLHSARPIDPQCLVEVEQCDEQDHDCDGHSHNQRCCATGDVNLVRLNGVISPSYQWHTVESELGVLIAIASQGQARLFSFSTVGGDSTLRATWPNVDQISLVGHYLSLVALVVTNVEGNLELLTNSQAEGADTLTRRPLPCAPLHVTVVDPSHAVRIYCQSHSVLIEADGEEIIEAYPEEGALNWVTQWNPAQSGEPATHLVVSLGEAYQLSLWRDSGRDGVLFAEDDTVSLPSSISDLVMAERVLPIQLPPARTGLLSRLIDQKSIEVWVPIIGWTPLGGQAWPFWASLSSIETAGVTVGFSEDPAIVGDQFLQRLDVRIHPLTQDGALLGERVKARVSRDSFGGIHFGHYTHLDGQRPNLLSLIGGSLELSHVNCETTVD